MSETGTSTERRQSPRVETSIPVRYRVLRDGAEAAGTGSVTCNLGAGGLRFIANEFLSTACRLVLELDIPAMTQPVKAVSKVAWIGANEGDDYHYEVGSQFMEITKKDQERIGTYLNNL